MKILVTGGAGFIGSNFVRMCLRNEFSNIEHVTVLDKLTYAGSTDNLKDVAENEKYTFIKGDICDSQVVENAFRDIDVVIHFAAESHVDRSIQNPQEFVRTNVEGTTTLLNQLRKQPNIRFVHVSTDEVYGSIKSGSWSEDFPLAPNSPYSASKAASDLVALAFCRTYGLNITVTRCCNNYGPYQNSEKLIPLFITNLLQDKKVPVYGDGKNSREWIHVVDHCRAIFSVLIKGKTGEIYNIGSRNEFSNLEITSKILNLMGKNSTFIEYVEDRKGHDFRYSLLTDKFENEIGVLDSIPFEVGLRETIEWYRSNELWWNSSHAN